MLRPESVLPFGSMPGTGTVRLRPDAQTEVGIFRGRGSFIFQAGNFRPRTFPFPYFFLKLTKDLPSIGKVNFLLISFLTPQH
jgi:hypothetical protein